MDGQVHQPTIYLCGTSALLFTDRLSLLFGNYKTNATTTQGGGGGGGGELDIWRDSPLRYAGYANEVGESFRNIAPRLVGPSCESRVRRRRLRFVAVGVVAVG